MSESMVGRPAADGATTKIGEPDGRIQQSARQTEMLANQSELRQSTRTLFAEIARIAHADIQQDLRRAEQDELER
ncbi:hypothetical protein ACPESR_12005 [Nocardia testacea]|uniref:hypothetical protein n=1 Tax=Nocardia testacea TaxID=248551 RepID=UPI003C308265